MVSDIETGGRINCIFFCHTACQFYERHVFRQLAVFVLVQREMEFCQARVIQWSGYRRHFYCVYADRGLIAAPWTPLAFLCVPFCRSSSPGIHRAARPALRCDGQALPPAQRPLLPQLPFCWFSKVVQMPSPRSQTTASATDRTVSAANPTHRKGQTGRHFVNEMSLYSP